NPKSEIRNPKSGKPWTGVDESGLKDVGYLECTLKRREHDMTRLEQFTEAELSIPEDANLPLLQLMGVLSFKSRADLSLDYGLEVFTAELSMGMGLVASSHGVRDNEELMVTQQIRQGRKILFDQLERMPIGAKSAPLVELMPFQRSPNVREGYSWDIAMLDSSLVSVDSNAKPRLIALRVRCTGRREIMHEGEKAMSYEVSSEDGKARAWYSSDGTVLKQAYTIADVLDVMVVRADPKTYCRRPNARRYGGIPSRPPSETPQKNPR
ncbi:MAG: hypothetical protein NTW87_03830, partial [Planctomycetota bacterium]|nr:hypothetical protein [Planctomycetota bacterium]